VPEQYFPVLLALGIAFALGGILLLLSWAAGLKSGGRRKLATYESGVPLLDRSRKRLSIAFFNHPNYDAVIECLPSQLNQVFLNLLVNAGHSIEERGTITIRTAYDAQAQAINVDVMDDGSGVPDHIRARMFEPYTSTKEGGTGLGLTIVNQIVSDHNGYIRYSDRKPRGTVFSMEFRVR